VILIVCVIVVHRQMTFVQSRDLGFKRDNIITFTSEGRLADSTETFLRGMKQIPGVINASVLDGDLVSLHSGTTAVDWDGKSPAQVIDFELMRAGYDLIETLGIKMKEGRDFSREFNTESSAVIFNEAAIESMGLTDPIGKTVKIWGQDKVIIGVVENFHFESLYENLKPFFFLITERRNNNFLVKIKGGTTRQTLADLTTYYQQFNLGLPFEYRFLDDDLQANYAAENRVSLLSRYFAGLAIFLSCLGLFGLAAFTAERRSKEIGIRKVLGSSEMALVILLSKDFTILVVLAIVVALPLSYIITDNWLAGFAYRITPQWFYFLGAGLAALTISWMTIGAQAIRAARTNPAKTLRSE
jgi:ABC-type antimicrobial peptide transport system permease subunit